MVPSSGVSETRLCLACRLSWHRRVNLVHPDLPVVLNLWTSAASFQFLQPCQIFRITFHYRICPVRDVTCSVP